MKLEGVHHITAITGAGAAERRLLRRHARPADGQEDRQPGRPDRLPPLLRRRAGRRRLRHHLLRVPRRAARAAPATAWSTRSAGGSPPTEALEFWEKRLAEHGTADRAATTATCASPTPRGSATRSRSSTTADEPLIADHPEVPKELALQGFDGARAYSGEPERSTPLLEAPRLRAHRRRLGGARRAARRPLGLRRAAGRAAASPAPAPSTTSPGPRRWTSTRPGARR